MGGGVSLLVAALLQAAAPAAPAAGQPQAPAQSFEEMRAAMRAEALRQGGPLVDQLIREADSVFYHGNPDGRARLGLRIRGRATYTDGVCESDHVTIVMEHVEQPPGTEPGRRARIREVESKRGYHLLRDPWNKPTWEVGGAELEAACAEASAGGYGWYEAPSAHEFRVGVLSLAAVERALADPNSPLIKVRCGRASAGGKCSLDRERWIAMIDPIFGGDIMAPDFRSTCGDGGRRCQRFMLLDLTICGHWDLEIESDWSEPLRLRSATFVQRPGGLIHCGGDGP